MMIGSKSHGLRQRESGGNNTASCASLRSNISSSFSRAIFSSRFKNLSRVVSKFVSRIHNREIQFDEIGYRFANFCTSVSLRHLLYFSLRTLNIFFTSFSKYSDLMVAFPLCILKGLPSVLGSASAIVAEVLMILLSTSHKRWNNASDFASVHIL